MSIVNLALLVGAAQGLLLSAVLVALRSSNTTANRLLAAFIGFEALHLLWLFLAYSELFTPPLLPMALLFNLRVLAGPALYLYVCSMTTPGYRQKMSQGLHLTVLLPSLVWSLLLIGRYSGQLPQDPREIQLLPSTVWLAFYSSLVFVIYGVVALRRLRFHRWRLEQALSTTENIRLWWLRAVIGLFVLANLLGLSLDILRLQQVIPEDPRIWINLTTTLLVIYLISFGGLRQPAVFTQSVSDALSALGHHKESPTMVGSSTTTGAGKYRKSGLDDQRIQELWHQLHDVLSNQELYRDPSLDLPALAHTLGVRPQELSQVISTSSSGSFYDLINDYRVEAAKQLLADPDSQNRKLFDIALTSGFSSQSTFYSQFKKRTGKTPSAFRASRTGAPQ